jgi:hypothetical protein
MPAHDEGSSALVHCGATIGQARHWIIRELPKNRQPDGKVALLWNL